MCVGFSGGACGSGREGMRRWVARVSGMRQSGASAATYSHFGTHFRATQLR